MYPEGVPESSPPLWGPGIAEGLLDLSREIETVRDRMMSSLGVSMGVAGTQAFGLTSVSLVSEPLDPSARIRLLSDPAMPPGYIAAVSSRLQAAVGNGGDIITAGTATGTGSGTHLQIGQVAAGSISGSIHIPGGRAMQHEISLVSLTHQGGGSLTITTKTPVLPEWVKLGVWVRRRNLPEYLQVISVGSETIGLQPWRSSSTVVWSRFSGPFTDYFESCEEPLPPRTLWERIQDEDDWLDP